MRSQVCLLEEEHESPDTVQEGEPDVVQVGESDTMQEEREATRDGAVLTCVL